MRKQIGLAVISGVMAAFQGAQPCQASIVIGKFDSNQMALVFGAPPGILSDFTQVAHAGSIGGFRDIFLTRTSGNQGLVAGDSNQTLTSFFSYSAGSTTAGVVSIQYDGNDNSPTIATNGLNDANLTYPSGTPLGFKFQATSDLGGDAIINVWTGGVVKALSTASVLVAASPSFTFAEYFIPFSAFAGADFTSVGAIEIVLGSRSGVNIEGLDMSIGEIVIDSSSIQQIPEPSAMVLGLLGAGLGLGSLARSRRSNRA